MQQTRSILLVLSVLSLTCLLVIPNAARAQAVAVAQVSGTVVDQSGSAIANAQVRMTETEKQTVHATVTDDAGRYVLPNLPVGPYVLEAQANGFKNYVLSGIELQVGSGVVLNVAMRRKAASHR